MRCLVFVLCVACFGCVDPAVRAGRLALSRGQPADAIAQFEAARSRDVEVAEDLASAHRVAAHQQFAKGQCEPAAAHLDAAEALTSPVLADRRAHLQCAESDGRGSKALAPILEALIALGDGRARVLRQLMLIHLDAGDDEKAAPYIAALERRFALTLKDRQRVAQSLMRQGRSQDALPHLLAIVEVTPTDPISRLKIAQLLAERGERGAARRAYTALTVDFPSNPIVHLRLARFLRSVGDTIGAQMAQARADVLRGIKPDERSLRSLRKSRH